MPTREEEIKRLAGDKGFASLTTGQKADLPSTQVITSEDLTPVTPINLPEQPTPDDTSATAAGALAIQEEEKKDETPAQTRLESMIAEDIAPESQTEAFIAARTTPEIKAKEERTKASRGRLLALRAEQTALSNIQADIPEQMQEGAKGRGITAGGLAPLERGRTRKVRRQQLDITNRILAESAIFSAESGDLTDALNKIDKIFELKVKDAEAQADFRDKQIDRAMEFASAEQQTRLETLKAKNNKEAEDIKSNNDTNKTFADAYIKAGDASTAASLAGATEEQRLEIVKANPLPEDKEKALRLQSLNLSITEKTESINALRQKRIDTAQDEKELASAEYSILQDKTKLIAEIKNHSGLDSRVGPGANTRQRWQLLDEFGAGDDFAGAVQQLTSDAALQELIDVKSRGATFGALQRAELDLLLKSSTRINSWELRDDQGVGLGEWQIDEKSFKRELDEINRLVTKAQRGLTNKIISPDEENDLGLIFSPTGGAFSPANYYSTP